MFKSIFAVSVTLLILSSTVLASTRCNPFTVTGSYVRQSTDGYGTGTLYIDQLRLDVDGGAYWFSSASFDYFLQGPFIPTIGSWTCLADGTVLVTAIGSQYASNAGDINVSSNFRSTLKLSVVDNNTLELTYSIITTIPLSNNPLGSGTAAGCTPSGGTGAFVSPCAPGPYKRILPQVNDIP